MLLFDICTTFSYLSDFVPLIQMLVGSVFVASYMSHEQIKYVPDKVVSEEVKDLITNRISDSGYVYKNNARIKDYQVVKKSVMSVMAIYGAFILFYCARFELPYMPSPFGVLLMNFLISIFLICKFFSLGVRIPQYSFSIVIGILVFLTFLICNLFHPDWLPFSDEWICNWHVIANIWMFVNMVICSFMFMLRRKLLSKLLTPPKLDCIVKKLTIDLGIVDCFEIVSGLNYISEKTKEEGADLWLLFRRAYAMLHEDKLYFNNYLDESNNLFIEKDYKDKLEQAINNSAFCRVGKMILCNRISKSPRVPTEGILEERINDRTKVFEKDAQMLIALGILVKKRTS